MTLSLGILVRKELSELRRDRRVLFLTLVLPVLLYPAVIGGMNRMESQRSEELRAQALTVAVDGGSDRLRMILADDESLRFIERPQHTFRSALDRAEISAGVVFNIFFANKII